MDCSGDVSLDNCLNSQGRLHFVIIRLRLRLDISSGVAWGSNPTQRTIQLLG